MECKARENYGVKYNSMQRNNQRVPGVNQELDICTPRKNNEVTVLSTSVDRATLASLSLLGF